MFDKRLFRFVQYRFVGSRLRKRGRRSRLISKCPCYFHSSCLMSRNSTRRGGHLHKRSGRILATKAAAARGCVIRAMKKKPRGREVLRKWEIVIDAFNTECFVYLGRLIKYRRNDFVSNRRDTFSFGDRFV